MCGFILKQIDLCSLLCYVKSNVLAIILLAAEKRGGAVLYMLVCVITGYDDFGIS